MKVGEVWKLIDLDAAAQIGKKAGLKSSTGYVPPELLILSNTGEASVRDPSQANALIAHSSFDMWSIGALLYLLITGQTLFHNNLEDNLDDQDLVRLYEWKDADLQAALKKVHNPKRTGKCQPLGRDLLEKLLQPKAGKRPKTIDDVLDHPFFTGESDGSDLASKAIIERVEVAIMEIGLVGEGVERNSQKIDRIAEKLCGLEQMGLDQIEGKHKCPSAMLLLRAEDEIPAVWTEVWEMIETEEETRLAELEEQRRVLQAQAAELVENINQVIPPQSSTWGRGFFARKHTGGASAEATVETINTLFTNTTEVTLGFVKWVEGMEGAFDSIYNRAKALHEEEEADVKKVLELVKLAIIVAKDISSAFKDLRQWYHFVNGALKQWKKGTKTGKQPLTKVAKKALKDLQHTRKHIRGSIKKKLQQALKWGIHHNTKIIETCEVVLNALTSESFDEDAEGDGEDEDGEGCEDADDGADADEDGGDGGHDFMSDMKSHCFRKFGYVAEDRLSKRTKIYDKVQIHLLCEYGGCHVPEGMPKCSNQGLSNYVFFHTDTPYPLPCNPKVRSLTR
jgi:hypothetical protein